MRDTCVSGTTVGLDAGLATNRNDRSTPRDSRLALDSFPASGCHAARDDCCGRSALCREHSAETALQVTGLAGHPPRLRVEEACCLTAKTLETHQGTSVFLLLLFLKSTKLSRPYLLCFQSSAARPQAHARILCNVKIRSLTGSNFIHYFRAFDAQQRSGRREFHSCFNCGNLAKILSSAAFRPTSIFARDNLTGYAANAAIASNVPMGLKAGIGG